MHKILFFLFVSSLCYGQTINFPDSNFRDRLLFHQPVIDTNNDGEIQIDEAAALTGWLIVQNGDISDLTGIEYFTNITGLDCSVNNLSELDLSTNSLLGFVNCNGNRITQLNLGLNNNLTALECERNLLSTLDVSNYTSLSTLNCRENMMENLIVTGAPLTVLICGDNNIETLDLSGQADLEILDCSKNQLNELDLSNLTSLTTAYCQFNSISSINLAGLTALEKLHCFNNNIIELDVHSASNLIELKCQENSITNIDLSNNGNIKDVDCRFNELTSLSIISNNFRNLLASNNLIADLNLNTPGGDFQQKIQIDNNLLSTLDLSETRMRYLNCENNLNLEYINLRNGRNWQFDYDSASFQNLPLLQKVCLDEFGANYIMIDFITDQVGHPVNFFNNEDCTELVLSVNENDMESELVLSPNPASTTITILGVSDINELLIYNQLGQIVQKEVNTKTIDISSLASGIYFVKITDAYTSHQVKRILKN